jgi:pyruvate/2-oxoglutarate dehydrogenase complex dihydrolipoamide dehydrogenase (E3) component
VGRCAGDGNRSSQQDFKIIRDRIAGVANSDPELPETHCAFTDPCIARVGLTEAQALKWHDAVRIAKMPTNLIVRGRGGENGGFMKALVCPKTDRILGFMIIGPEAHEVLGAIKNTMMKKLPYSVLAGTIFAHPAMSEGLGPLFDNLSAPIATASNV